MSGTSDEAAQVTAVPVPVHIGSAMVSRSTVIAAPSGPPPDAVAEFTTEPLTTSAWITLYGSAVKAV